MASWLVRLTPDQVVQVQALAGVIVLCFQARHFTLTVLLFTYMLVQMGTSIYAGGNPAVD